ncbi:MAG: hypothetical protein ACRC33_24810 [Gemmataceae bacterium]
MRGNAAVRAAVLSCYLLTGVTAAPIPQTVPAGVKKRLLAPAWFLALEIDKTPVSETLRQLSKHHDIRIRLDAEAYERAGVRKPADVRLAASLRYGESLFRFLRRVASVLHPEGVLDIRGDTIFLTTVADLKARGRKPHQFPVSEESRRQMAATRNKLNTIIDFDLDGVDPRDAVAGPILELVARKYKVDIDVREEVFAAYGQTVLRRTFTLPPAAMRIPLWQAILLLTGSPKVPGDELALMIDDDGAVVVTTKKYRDGPVPAGVPKRADE